MAYIHLHTYMMNFLLYNKSYDYLFDYSLTVYNILKPLAGLTSACFKVPFMKNIYTWAQAVSIDKKNLIRMLDNGYSPVICPGGVQEVLLMESTDECKIMII